uniref:Uncharacterized protein n=1 Tax=Anguilla anguilla TaxID=7936 RepID=A0A0E9XYP2_ANGAN
MFIIHTPKHFISKKGALYGFSPVIRLALQCGDTREIHVKAQTPKKTLTIQSKILILH